MIIAAEVPRLQQWFGSLGAPFLAFCARSGAFRRHPRLSRHYTSL